MILSLIISILLEAMETEVPAVAAAAAAPV